MAKKNGWAKDSISVELPTLMEAKGMTYRALAEQSHLSAGYLNHIVHGNRPVPDDDVLERIASALGVELEHFREHRERVVAGALSSGPVAKVDRLYRELA